MSNRSLLEFNHDYCPASDADCLALGRALRDYMRAADPRDLPPGVRRYDYRHHSDPDHAATLAKLRAETHVVVPREPTREMVEAGDDKRLQNLATCEVWRAMLAATEAGDV